MKPPYLLLSIRADKYKFLGLGFGGEYLYRVVYGLDGDELALEGQSRHGNHCIRQSSQPWGGFLHIQQQTRPFLGALLEGVVKLE